MGSVGEKKLVVVIVEKMVVEVAECDLVQPCMTHSMLDPYALMGRVTCRHL